MTIIGGIIVAAILVIAMIARSLNGSATSDIATDHLGGALERLPTSEPSEEWTARVDGSVNAVAAHDGNVFVVSSDADESFLISFDSNGEERWREEVDDWADQLRFVDGLLLSSPDSDLTATTAYDANTGKRVWRSDVYPAVDLGGGDWLGVIYDSQNSVVRMSLSDGHIRWETDGWGAGGDAAYTLVNDDDEVRVVDTTTGDEVWSDDALSAAYSDGRVAVADEGRMTVVDLSSGEERWRGRADEVLAIDDGIVLARNGDETVAFDLSDGTELWHFDGDATGSVVDGQVTIFENQRATVVSLHDGDVIGRSDRETLLEPIEGGWVSTSYDGARREFVRYDRSMSERWSVTLKGETSGFTGGILWVADGRRITVHR